VERSSLEERVARIEGILEQMDKRLNHLESEIRNLRVYVESEFKSLRGEISGLRRDLNNRFLWILGVRITMWVTIILAMIFK
jgi:predicted nuclease with TOPRIM domain